jgi:RNA polymerase sigma-70 factor (ECF subfamily)
MLDVARAAEIAARDAYGRLVAYLAARWGDVMAAEDALGDAFLAALEQWPQTGVPRNPDGWLLVVARRRLLDGARRGKWQAPFDETLENSAALAGHLDESAAVYFPDERLRLLFACAHPALERTLHTPLMLQTVLGLNAALIAAAFLVSPTAMSQRLVRAKSKIRDANIRFDLPEAAELRPRLQAVLEAIYAAYTTGWGAIAGADERSRGLADEAIWLGRLALQLLPEEPEAKGLLALMLHCEARRAARLSPTGDYVPLSEQNVERWAHPLIEEAEALLRASVQAGALGRFQLEAAIQSAHSLGMIRGQTDWGTIALLYEGLVAHSPTIGALVGRAAALANAFDAPMALAALATLPAESVNRYQPYWALKAHLHSAAGEAAAAQAAYTRAIGLSEDAAVRAFLLQRVAALT